MMTTTVVTTTHQGSPSCGTSGGASKDGGGGTACSLVNHMKAKFNIDGIELDATKSILEMAAITDEDLPPFSFDFEDIWEKLNVQISREADQDDYTDVISDIVAINKEFGASQLNCAISEELILEGMTDDDFLPMSPLIDLKEVLGNMGGFRRDDGHTDGPATKKFKGEAKQKSDKLIGTTVTRKSGDAEMQQFVFVNEVSSNKKRVLTLRKGEKLPPGFEMASISGEVPPLPEELASFPPTALKEAILGVANPNSGTGTPTTSPRSVKIGGNAIKPTEPAPPRKLISLVDLMTSEMQKKEKMEKKKKLETPEKVEKPRIVYKQRGVNTSKVVSLLNRQSDEVQRMRGVLEAGTTVRKRDSDPAHTNSTQTNALLPKPRSGSNRSDPGQISPIKPLPTLKPKPNIVPSISSTTDDVEPAALEIRPTVEVKSKNESYEGLMFGCKLCGETFPCHCDNIFRKHMLVKHDIEIKDDQYFEDSKVYPMGLRRCRKCRLLVLNNYEDHQKKCLPLMTVETAFENVIINSKNLVQLACGLCRFSKSFGMRYELKKHFEDIHEGIGTKMIFDPEFRCSQCLKRFDEAIALSKHCVTCTDTRPRTETVLELAKSLLFCDLCYKKHSSIEETLACFLARNIRRCVFCLATFKDKALFYKHLFTYHGLKLQPKMLLTCPICIGKEPDKIVNVTQHMVSDHFGPALLTINQTLPMPPPIQRSQPPPAPTTKIITSTTTPTTSVVPRKLPDLQPLTSKPHNPNLPPGIVINTTRLNPSQLITQRPSTIVTSTVPTASRMVFQQRVIPTTIRQQSPTSTPLFTMQPGGGRAVMLIPVQQGTPGTFPMRPTNIITPQGGAGPVYIRSTSATPGSANQIIRLPISISTPIIRTQGYPSPNQVVRPKAPVLLRPQMVTSAATNVVSTVVTTLSSMPAGTAIPTTGASSSAIAATSGNSPTAQNSTNTTTITTQQNSTRSPRLFSVGGRIYGVIPKDSGTFTISKPLTSTAATSSKAKLISVTPGVQPTGYTILRNPCSNTNMRIPVVATQQRHVSVTNTSTTPTLALTDTSPSPAVATTGINTNKDDD